MSTVDATLLDVQPEIYDDYRALKADIREQKLEKARLKKTID
jgi:hypothetical protein